MTNQSSAKSKIINNRDVNIHRIDSLYNRVNGHIILARSIVQRSINSEMLRAYFLI